jgi:hypothetical protein
VPVPALLNRGLASRGEGPADDGCEHEA